MDEGERNDPGNDVLAVILCGFDHVLGPTNEFVHPPALAEDVDLLNSNLPFLALPDGAHTKEEDYSYFHLRLPQLSDSTIFGISCNRQIASEKLLNKGKEVTRSTVQKAIVVLARKPIFGPLRDKLGLITRAYFAQQDFADKSILVDLFDSLRQNVDTALVEGSVDSDGEPTVKEVRGDDEESGIYMGTSLRELVHKFRYKTLMLLKLLLLQRKVMFYASSAIPVESLCTYQYSLVSLIPSLLLNLHDSASPVLSHHSSLVTSPPTTLKTSDKGSLIKYLGLPLNIFGEGAFFQPYLPLQQIDMLIKSESYLVGTTNAIFQQQRDCNIDVVVNIDTATLNILDQRLTPLLALTPADRKWADELVTLVDASWNASDPSRPLGLNFVGSDDFLRAKFEEYICSMLSCIKFTDYLSKSDRPEVLLSSREGEHNSMGSFNESFIHAFRATPAFELWNKTTDDVIFDLVEPRHPMEGKTNAIEDVGIRLAHGLHDLHLEENLAPTREAITGALESGWKTYASLKTDLARRQKDFVESRERDRVAASGGRRESGTTLLGGRGERRESGVEEGGLVNGLTPVIAVTATNVLAGMDVAKTQASALAAGFGSFLSSKRTQLFPTTPPALDSSTSSSTSTTSKTTGHVTTTTNGSFGSFFRPLSLASSADATIVLPLPSSSTATAAAGVAPPNPWSFPSFRRTASSSHDPSSSRSTTATGGNGERQRTPEKVVTAGSLMGYDEDDFDSIKDLDAGDERVRDLDAEHAAASLRAQRLAEEKAQHLEEAAKEEEEVESPESSPSGKRIQRKEVEVEEEEEEEGDSEFVEAGDGDGEDVGELREVAL